MKRHVLNINFFIITASFLHFMNDTNPEDFFFKYSHLCTMRKSILLVYTVRAISIQAYCGRGHIQEFERTHTIGALLVSLLSGLILINC